jgi:hypothetical protein
MRRHRWSEGVCASRPGVSVGADHAAAGTVVMPAGSPAELYSIAPAGPRQATVLVVVVVVVVVVTCSTVVTVVVLRFFWHKRAQYAISIRDESRVAHGRPVESTVASLG